jgi:starvation-inducible DNA-binding protein
LLRTQQGDGHADTIGNPDLHALYETQSKQIHDVVLEVTERVWILGGVPLHSAEQFTDSTRLGGEGNPFSGILSLLADHEAFIRYVRDDAQKCSEMYEDQGTHALLISVLRKHEKMAWILRSNIAPGYFDHEK